MFTVCVCNCYEYTLSYPPSARSLCFLAHSAPPLFENSGSAPGNIYL